jgi:hypothetical protein
MSGLSSYFVSSRLVYVVLIFILFAAIVSVIFNKWVIALRSSDRHLIVISMLIFLSWIYGVVLGVFKGVQLQYVFSNFFGLFFYILLIAFVIIQPKFKLIARIIFFGFLIQLLLGIYLSYQNLIPLVSSANFQVTSMSNLRSYYSTGFIFGFPIFALATYAIVNRVNIPDVGIFGLKSAMTIWFFSLFLVVVPAFSKGFILAALFIFLYIIVASFFRALITVKVSKRLAVIFIFLPLLTIVVLTPYYDLLVFSFSYQEASNSIRQEQAAFIIKELTFFGAGLGSGLDSGYVRASVPYAFELTYLSIIHKLGFFALPLFLAYFWVFYKSMINLVKRRNDVVSATALGLMGYAIVGIGNPILLGGLGVFFHCMALYFLTLDHSHHSGFDKIESRYSDSDKSLPQRARVGI